MPTRGPVCGDSNLPQNCSNGPIGVDEPVLTEQGNNREARRGPLEGEQLLRGQPLLAQVSSSSVNSGRTKPKRKKRHSGKTTDKLFLMDPELWPEQTGGRLVAESVYGTSIANTKQINNWNDLAKAIRQHSTITELVLYFHGSDGQLTVGGESWKLDESKIRNLFTGSSGIITQVENITLLGCNVGRDPAAMAAFGALFQSKTVTAYTWYILINVAEFKIDKGSTETSLKGGLKEIEHWVMPPTSYKEMAQRSSAKSYSQNLLLMYGSLMSTKLSLKDHMQNKSMRTTKPMGEAKVTKMSKSKISGLNTKQLTLSFEKVVISL